MSTAHLNLLSIRYLDLVYGVGVSGDDLFIEDIIEGWADTKIVLHRIVGVDKIIHSLPHSRVLVLGYKRRGRGTTFDQENIDRRIAEWRFWAPHLLSLVRHDDAVVSFDNLALEQLGIQELVSEDVWAESYMGDDGQFTMFVDAVEDTFAASSTAEIRTQRNGRSLREVFAEVRKGKNDAE